MYRLTRSQKYLEEHFGAHGEVEVSPGYNIAPSQPVITIRQDATKPVRILSTMRWGLVPSWAKDTSTAFAPNSLVSNIHDRMPVILSPDDYDLWLDLAFRDTASLTEMLRPFNAGLMRR